MLIDIVKKKGNKIEILYNGRMYIFNDAFKGLFGVVIRNYTDKNCDDHFDIYYGNSHNVSEYNNFLDLKFIKNYIEKNENKYIQKKNFFEHEKQTNCDIDYYFNFKVYGRKDDIEI